MKKFLILLLTLGLLLSACGTKPPETGKESVSLLPDLDEESTETASVGSDSEEEVPFGLSYMPQYGLNPYECNVTSNRALFSLLYESLFVVTHDFSASPVLCESFESSGGGTLYQFRLLPNARFSDGSLLTAEDVKASLLAAEESPMYSARLEHISSINILEDGSLEISLDTPYENFALMLDVPILKATTIEASKPVGTGPYRLQGQSLVRNTHWWREDHGVLSCDRIPLSAAKESNDLRNHFEFGNTDLIYCDPNSTAAVGYRCDYEVWEAPTTVMHYLGFNLKRGWFTNELFRSAVTYAIDRDAFANEVYNGFAQPSPLPCSPASPFYDEQLAEEYDYAPAKYQEALTASGILTSSEYEGYSGIFLVCLDDPARVKLADRICKVLNDSGLSLTVTALEQKQYDEALKNQEFDIYLGEVRLTTNFDLTEFFLGNGDLQYGSIGDSGLITLCADTLANSGSCSELYRQILRSAYICPVAFKSYAIYVTRGKIDNNAPGVDLVFFDGNQARTLADAYKTQREEDTTP